MGSEMCIRDRIPVEADEPVTVFDMFFANTQAKFMALFLVIFAVMFSTADISSGYIKNIGGQVKNRGFLIASKTFALAVFTILSMAIFVVVQTVAVRIFFGRVMWGEPKDFLTYFGIQVLLHCALLILCMTIAILLRNNVVSMVIAVCLTMNVMSILYSAVDKIVQKAGIEDFQLIQYTLTGKISLLSMTPGVRECMEALGGAAVFGIVLAMLCGFVFEKRDI